MRFYFEKLVRDNIVDDCENDPKVLKTSWRTLKDAEYRRELVKKVSEEALEIPSSNDNPEKMAEEVGDLQAVVDALREVAGLSEEQVRTAAIQKAAKKGSFVLRRYIDYVDLTDDSEWVENLRAQPDKYREVSEEQLSERDIFSPKPDLPLGRYRHYKGGEYEVMMLACDEATHEWLVIYTTLHEQQGIPKIWARKYELFTGMVEVNGIEVPRFERTV